MIDTLNSWAGNWIDFMVNSSVQLSFLFIVLLLLTYIFRKRSALFLHSLWIVFLLKAVLPPSIPIPLLKNSEILPQITLKTFTPSNIQTLTETVNKASVLHLNSILLLLWIGIVLLLVGFVLLKNLLFRRRLRQAHPIDERSWDKSFEQENRELSQIQFYIQERISSPFTLNIRRPRIYLPADWIGWKKNQKQAVLLHEFAHIKRKDLLINLFQNIIQIIYFFHPAVWMANRYIAAYREQACDDYVISRLNNKALEYSKMIISSLDRSRGLNRYSSLVNCFVQDRRALIRRFEYLINRKEEIMQKFKAKEKVVLGGLCLLALALSLKSVERSASIQEKMISGNNFGDYSGERYIKYDIPPTPLKGFSGLAESINIPERTKSTKVEGAVFVSALIDGKGKANVLGSIRTDGDCGPNESKAVVDALKGSQWNPALKKGEPIDSRINLIFVFKLNEDTNRIYIEVIPPPPPPPIPPTPPKMDIPVSPKNPPVPSLPPEPVLPNKNKPVQPLLEKAMPFPSQPPKPPQPLEPETPVLASAAPLPEIPPPPDKAIPIPPPFPYTPWDDPDYQTDQDLDKKPEPIVGIDNLTQNVHDSQEYQENKKFARSRLILGVLVEETGKLNAVLILQSSGQRELDQTFIDHLLAADWKPGEKDGRPVKAKTTFTFTIKD